jgi:hypothetical protein
VVPLAPEAVTHAVNAIASSTFRGEGNWYPVMILPLPMR